METDPQATQEAVKHELDKLAADFFHAVSFEPGGQPW